ncbi:MAG TPA: 4-alpha-glucanotransferase [Vicinamibacterales bacterium]|nr:4-alpha-glucanotransferase [Vicinamibacterales bacterium]
MVRQSGIAVPLFSLASNHGWGIGEFLDLPEFAQWMQQAGQSVIQILPIQEMPPLESSPYSAMTAMALDPIYLSLADVADFEGIGGLMALDGADRAEITRLRALPRIEYASVRRLKDKWLRRSFDRFLKLEVSRGTSRALRFDQFKATQAWWLDEYVLFRALHAHHDEADWTRWPEPLARCDHEAIREIRPSLQLEMTYRAYLQWLAADQWFEARRRSWPARVFGDLPFMISADSPDVWARQDEFRFDATIGVPPDAFSETGQDWGLPPWRAARMRESGFRWMRNRARRYASLFDGYRIDHLVGLYRMYVRPLDKSIAPFFDPPDEPAQIHLGQTLVQVLRGLDEQTEIFAEDLGSIPPFVRESMARLNLSGLKVLRWERHWDRDGHPPIDPATFPPRSVATTGTHDIEPLAATPEGRTEDQRSAILQSLLSAGSMLALIPVQDIFGWTDRINTPAVVDEINWTWKLPWPVDTWLQEEEALSRADQLQGWTRGHHR